MHSRRRPDRPPDMIFRLSHGSSEARHLDTWFLIWHRAVQGCWVSLQRQCHRLHGEGLKNRSTFHQFEVACDSCIVDAYMLRELMAGAEAAAMAGVRTKVKFREN